MRHLVLLATWTFVGALLVVSGLYLVVPSRNARGNPRLEREMASCVLPDDAEVKLYQGDGGSSSDNWYSVTHDPAGLEPERQIVYRYRAPALYDLVCDSVGVIIRTDDAPITLTAAQANGLRRWPEGFQPSRTTKLATGGALMAAGFALLWFLRPRRGDGLDYES
jgi:hypothetical protein